MKTKILASAALLLGVCLACTPERQANVDYVDPFIGTGFHGHTYPGATVPHGAVQLSPDTRAGNWDACAGYHYSDQTLKGFSHTHLSGTGCIDLGDLLFRPTTQEINLEADTIYRAAAFSHLENVPHISQFEVGLTPSIGQPPSPTKMKRQKRAITA